jgi:hypothetical protein
MAVTVEKKKKPTITSICCATNSETVESKTEASFASHSDPLQGNRGNIV